MWFAIVAYTKTHLMLHSESATTEKTTQNKTKYEKAKHILWYHHNECSFPSQMCLQFENAPHIFIHQLQAEWDWTGENWNYYEQYLSGPLPRNMLADVNYTILIMLTIIDIVKRTISSSNTIIQSNDSNDSVRTSSATFFNDFASLVRCMYLSDSFIAFNCALNQASRWNRAVESDRPRKTDVSIKLHEYINRKLCVFLFRDEFIRMLLWNPRRQTLWHICAIFNWNSLLYFN